MKKSDTKNKKTAEATGGLIRNKIEDKMKRIVTQSTLETASQTDEKSAGIQKRKYILLEKRLKKY